MRGRVIVAAAVFLILSSMAILAITGCTLWVNSRIKGEIDRSDKALGINRPGLGQRSSSGSHESMIPANDIASFALFGVDSDNTVGPSRSDLILIMTMDSDNKKIKISSIMRDLIVPIDGHSREKICHAYSYGGPQLAIKTINQNFGLEIRDYVTVDFKGAEKIIDVLGGIYIDVKDYEIKCLNENVESRNSIIEKAGLQHLNGEQAVSYARIRKAGNGDFERTERQRRILTYLLQKVCSSGMASLPVYAELIYSHVRTSMDVKWITALAANFLQEGCCTLEEGRFPKDGYWKEVSRGGMYGIVTDMELTRKQIRDFLYGDMSETEL